MKLNIEVDDCDLMDQIVIQTLKNLVREYESDMGTYWSDEDKKLRKRVKKSVEQLLREWYLNQDDWETFKNES